MVDFNKKVYNTDKFRLSALYFKENQCYTKAPEGTTDYNNYWDREADRCINGYVAPDGDSITGYYYFYLNYSPIMRLEETVYKDRFGKERTRRSRIFDFPSFWDYDYYYYNAIEDAETEGKHMAVLKARQRGYSFKGASMLVRNYSLIPKSKNFAVASELKYLTGDGLLTKAWQIMDFIDLNTGWAKRRLKSTALERTSGFKIKDEVTGKETEDGYLSSITGITLKNDPERIRGTRGKLVLWEESGKFKDIKKAWSVERPAVETDDGFAFGLMIAYGTGGEEGADFEGLKDMFYYPEGFNILGFPNIWDENSLDKKCAFFVPSWSNLETKNGGVQCMDKDGNSIKEAAMKIQIDQRNKVREGLSDETVTDRFIAEHPLTPLESMLEVGTNIFPKKLLLLQLDRIRSNKKLLSMKHVVDLSYDGNGLVQATEKTTGDICNYPLKKENKPEGSVVIWEYPIKDPPYGLYIAGCLTKGLKVCTENGLKNVEDVTLNDKLINKDGHSVNIRNLLRYKKENEAIYTIKPNGSFRSTTFTGEHPIFTTRGFIKAKDLKENDILRIPNKSYCFPGSESYLCNFAGDMNIDDSLLEKLFWFFGLWIGDGFCNVNGNSYDIYLSFGNNEEELAKIYDNVIKELFHRKTVHVHKSKEQTRRFTCKLLVIFLNNYFGKYANGKRIPLDFMMLKDNLLINFLYGYLDSDGCVLFDKDRLRINYTSVNLELLESVLDILYKLHIGCSIVKHLSEVTNKIINSKESYRINIRSGYMHCFNKNNVITGRKEKKISEYFKNHIEKESNSKNMYFDDNYIYLKVGKIEKSLYTGIVYNFECDSHTYMCRNILTHNCDPLDISKRHHLNMMRIE